MERASTVIGLRPWRCEKCGGRFLADLVPVRFLLLAHCDRCGNFDLQRVSANLVQRWNRWLFRVANIPAYRCPPCRNKFFSILPRRRLRPIDSPFGRPITDAPAEAVTTVEQDPPANWIR